MRSAQRLTLLIALHNGKCQKCGRRVRRYWPSQTAFYVNRATIEHVIPRCFGGTNDLCNLTLFCQLCNHQGGVLLSAYLSTRPRLRLSRRSSTR